MQEADSNRRPSGYEPDELPGCSTLQCELIVTQHRQSSCDHIKWARKIAVQQVCAFWTVNHVSLGIAAVLKTSLHGSAVFLFLRGETDFTRRNGDFVWHEMAQRTATTGHFGIDNGQFGGHFFRCPGQSWTVSKPLTMSKTAQNKLTIEPITEAGVTVKYRLFGYVETPDKAGRWARTKIRRWSSNLCELETEKKNLEDAAIAHQLQIKNSTHVHQTWLTFDQLRDAEAAVRKLPAGRTLTECVENAQQTMGDGLAVECEVALKRWEERMKQRSLEPKTITENLSRSRRFVEWAKVSMLAEIQPTKVEDYVLRSNVAPLTQLGDARTLHAWGCFCIREKFLKQNFVQLDLVDLRSRAKPKGQPEILSPTEAKKLLSAACEFNKPVMVFFMIASTWCFLRRAEVLRLTAEDIIDKEDGSIKIHLRGKKLGSRWRDVPVPSNVAPLFREAIKRGALTERNADTGLINLSEWDWKHIRARAGLLTLKTNDKRPDRPVIDESDWAPNILRHTGMSYLFQENGGDIEAVTKRAGNSADVAFMHYLRRAEEDAYKKFNAITASFPVAHKSAQAVA
jgi:integrase